MPRNAYKNDPAKLAAWVTASQVEHHTPVLHVKPAPRAGGEMGG